MSDSVAGSSSNKKQKVTDLSQLPVDCLLEIFDYSSKDDNSMKALTETCTLFEELCSRRLNLHLDMDRIRSGETFSKFARAYRSVILTGSEVPRSCLVIKKMVQSSSVSAKTLVIGGDSKKLNNRPCKIVEGSLLFLLRSLLNIEELTMNHLKVLKPRLKREAIKEEEFPILPKLLKLSLMKNHNAVQSLVKVKSVVRLELETKLNSPEERSVSRFLKNQQGLQFLKSVPQVSFRVSQ